MYQKRQKTLKNWPVERKGTAYVVRSNFSPKKGIPVLVALRDELKIAKNKREVRQAIHKKQVLLNGRVIKKERNGVLLYDVLTIVPSKEFYMLTLEENGKYTFESIKGTAAEKKIAKIVGKKTLPKKRTQINLSDGNNFLTTEKYQTNDSVVLDLKKRKIEKTLPLKEGAQVLIFSGKHSGKKGIIKKIEKEEKKVELKTKDKEINVLIKQIMVIQ